MTRVLGKSVELTNKFKKENNNDIYMRLDELDQKKPNKQANTSMSLRPMDRDSQQGHQSKDFMNTTNL